MNKIPNNKKTEMAILGAVFISQDNAYNIIESLNIDSFYDTGHQVIFESMKKLLTDGVNIDMITMNDYITRNKIDIATSYLMTLAECVPVTANINDYCNILKRTQYEREIYYLTEKYKEGQIEFDELTEKILSFPALNEEPDEQTLKDLFVATLKKSSEGVAYKFRLEILNKYLGGLDKGELLVIGAHTSQGKSMLGLQLATDFAEQGHNILYCTSEMSPEESARRILSRLTKTNITDFRYGNLDESIKTRISQAGNALGDAWNINIKYTVYTSEIRKYIRRYNPDIVFIDHLHNMDRKEPRLSDYQRVTYNVRDIQIMNIQTKLPFVVLAQFNRNNKEQVREPRLSDLRESGAIEEKANICLFIYWKDQLMQKVKPRRGGESPEKPKLIIAKNRDGVLGKWDMNFYPEYCTFETPEWHNEELMEEVNELIKDRG